jgi:hypothetical protein
MDESKPDDFSEQDQRDYNEWFERMRRNEADLLEILLRWGVERDKGKDPHELLAKQYARMAEHHRNQMRKPEDDEPL